MILIVKKDENDPRDEPETVEISCGWSLLPLFTSDGRDMESKTYDMQIFGGNPSEKDVALAAPIPLKTSFFTKLLTPTISSPRLTIKVWKMSKQAISSLK
jgi:hypothetical protein